jgi:hypothetical protein
LLPSRELGRSGMGSLPESNTGEGLLGALQRLTPSATIDQEGDGHIFGGSQGWQQVEGLEHKTDVVAALARLVGCTHLLPVVIEDLANTLVLVEDASNDGNERGLPTSGRSNQHQQFARLYVQLDAAQRHDSGIASAIGLGHSCTADRDLVGTFHTLTLKHDGGLKSDHFADTQHRGEETDEGDGRGAEQQQLPRQPECQLGVTQQIAKQRRRPNP